MGKRELKADKNSSSERSNEREAKSARTLSTPGTEMTEALRRLARRRRARKWRSGDKGPSVVKLALRSQDTADVLSEPGNTVKGWADGWAQRTASWAIVAMSSSMELLMDPDTLEDDTRSVVTDGGNGMRPTRGVAAGAKEEGNHRPPMPAPDASQAPTK